MSARVSARASAETSAGVGAQVVAAYALQLGDDALVYAQRLGEWVSRAPEIEEDLALTNIGLDLLGQARALLARAGELEGRGRTENDLAYLRDERDFHNVQLVELPAGKERDFGLEMARLLWFSAYQCELYAALCTSADEVVAGVAGKAVKEVTYHRDHASSWVVRLGDGTPESHRRMQDALERVSPYAPELFADDEVSAQAAAAGVGVRPSTLRQRAHGVVAAVIAEATLRLPEPARQVRGGRQGVHGTSMGYLLAEMQHLARSHPGASW